MKKILSSCLSAIAIFLFLFTLVACEKPAPVQQPQTPPETTLIQKGFSPGDWVNALVSSEKVKTKPRFDCNGRRLPQDKIVGYEKVTEVQCVQILGNCCECPPSNGGHGISNPPVPAPSIINNYPEPISWLGQRSMWELFFLFVFFPWLLLLLTWLLIRRFGNSTSTPAAPPSTPPAPAPVAPLGLSGSPSFKDFVDLEKGMSPGSSFTYKQGHTEMSVTKGNGSAPAKPKAEKATTEKPSVEQPKQ